MGGEAFTGGMPRSLRAFPAPREPPAPGVQHFTFALTDLTGCVWFLPPAGWCSQLSLHPQVWETGVWEWGLGPLPRGTPWKLSTL